MSTETNSIYDLSGGSNAVLYGVAAPANSMGFRNRIINGDMRIDQRNAGASVTPADGAYTLDRWNAGLTQASKFSVQRSTTAPAGYTNSLLVTSLSAYSVGSGDLFRVSQYVEGFNAADLGWGAAGAQSVTLSFWVRSSLTGTFSGSLANSAFNRSYPFTFTINAANTWEQKSVTIAGDTSGTWLTDNGIGIRVAFSLGAGSTYSGTAGAWAASALTAATGATSVVGTNGATFYITGVQLEAGSVASPFERVDYGRQLAMCQRYYQVFAAGSFAFAGRTSSTSAVLYGVPLQAAMRASPTINNPNILAYGPTSAATTSGGANTVITFGTNSIIIQTTGYSGLTDDRCYNGYVSTASLTLNAEL